MFRHSLLYLSEILKFLTVAPSMRLPKGHLNRMQFQKKLQNIDVVDDSLKYRFEEKYPGDEDLIITNDSWEKVPVFKAIVRLNEEGHIEERQKDLRYNFAGQDHERSLILGVPGFGSTFNYPHVVNYTVKIYVSSIDGDTRDHSHRGHLVDKIVSYMSREDKSPLPPFLLDGDASMGKTAVVGKSLQTFVKRLTEGAWSKLQTTKSPEGSTDLGEYPPNQVETNAAPEMQVVKPVLIARVCGLTPDSSNSRALVNSLVHQIFMAYDQPAERAEILSLESYRQAIRLARSEKPLIVILSKLDRLDLSCHSPLKLSWILDIPPFVRFVFTVKTSTRPTSCHEIVASRVREMAPNVLYASAAADQRPPPSQGLLESCADDFLLNVGTIITPIAKSSIERLLAIDGRKLRMDQEEAVRFAEAEPAHDGKHVPIRMLKQIYKISKDWKSSDQIGDFSFPKTIQEALDHELDVLEVFRM
ncbi:hypothetical protein HDU78_010570, partial [Chytriomyces hyalinus]